MTPVPTTPDTVASREGFDPTRPKTRGGQRVIGFHGPDRSGHYGGWVNFHGDCCWRLDGTHCSGDRTLDLVNVPDLPPTEAGESDGALEALREFIYETTHLSPEENDGSHRCRISKACLARGRAALARRAVTSAGAVAEPVAWEYRPHANAKWHPARDENDAVELVAGYGGGAEARPLYAAPPAAAPTSDWRDVATAERERCAQVCEARAKEAEKQRERHKVGSFDWLYWQSIYEVRFNDAAAIRAQPEPVAPSSSTGEQEAVSEAEIKAARPRPTTDQIQMQCAHYGDVPPRCLILERNWPSYVNVVRCKLCPAAKARATGHASDGGR